MNEAQMRRSDRLAATSSDEAVQLRFIEHGDTEQRELVLANPNLTTTAIKFAIERTVFNPARVHTFLDLPNITDELRAQVRTW